MRTTRFLLAGLASLATAAAQAQPADPSYKVVPLPEMKAWCAAKQLGKAAAEDPAQVDAARTELEQTIDKALLESGTVYSGVPFVARAQRIATAPALEGKLPPPPDALRLEVCAATSGAGVQTSPAGLHSLTMAAGDYAVRRCPDPESEACVSELRKTMLEAYGSDARDSIYESPILITLGAATETPADIAAAFAAARDRATIRALTLSGTAGAGLSLDNEATPQARPLLLDSKAQVLVAGAPTPNFAFAAIRVPAK